MSKMSTNQKSNVNPKQKIYSKSLFSLLVIKLHQIEVRHQRIILKKKRSSINSKRKYIPSLSLSGSIKYFPLIYIIYPCIEIVNIFHVCQKQQQQQQQYTLT